MFKTKKEILEAFKKIKTFIISDTYNTEHYINFIGRSKLAKKIWCAFFELFKIGTISDVGEIIERFYNIKISYLRTDDWEDKLLNLYNICDKGYLEIE